MLPDVSAEGQNSKHRVGAFRRQVPAWLVVPPTFAAVIATYGWVADARPAAVVWGDVATWVTGVATTTALLVAAMELARSRKADAESRRSQARAIKEERDSVARAVGVSARLSFAGVPKVNITVFNAGAYPIGDVTVQQVNQGPTGVDQDLGPEYHLGPLQSGGDLSNVMDLADARGEARVRVRFLDAWGSQRSVTAAVR